MLQVEAVDGDKGINDLMTYSISSENGAVPRMGWGRGGVGVLSEPLEAAAPAASCQTPQGQAGLTSGRTG